VPKHVVELGQCYLCVLNEAKVTAKALFKEGNDQRILGIGHDVAADESEKDRVPV